MLKTSGINSGWDDEMKWFIALMGFLMCTFAFCMGAFVVEQSKEMSNKELLQDQKTALEIKILQHELAAYEAMEKELKSE